MQRLKERLEKIDGQGYKAYKTLEDSYQFDKFKLTIDHVQGDAFALPSRISAAIPFSISEIPPALWLSNNSQSGNGQTIQEPLINNDQLRRIALEDFLGRIIKGNIKRLSAGARGSGNSGIMDIETSGQQCFQRNAVVIHDDYIEARLVIGLPANNRRVAGQVAYTMFFEELPDIIEQSLCYSNLDKKQLKQHIDSVEDQDYLRQVIATKQLVAFVANQSVLPRKSGVSDEPMANAIVPFQSPPSLQQTFTLPNAGEISGMGIPEGVTIIIGGGFHGKSTLLNALEHGPFNHIPGDGREHVVSLPSSVKIRSENGRVISKLNISPFINHLPFNRDTVEFSTNNASGSTSQAANIIEALECQTQLLLIDEDTSATNFMIRDQRMQQLVASDKEPITPFLHRAKELYELHAISSIIVMGGSGDYFDVADTVIMLDEYQLRDVTHEAKQLAQINQSTTSATPFNLSTKRKPGPKTLISSRQHYPVKIDVREPKKIHYGEQIIDMLSVDQLYDIGQTHSISLIIHYYEKHYNEFSGNYIEVLKQILEKASSEGLDFLSPYKVGNLALPRLYEVAAAINRIRSDDWQFTDL